MDKRGYYMRRCAPYWGTPGVYSTMTKVTDRAKTKVTENDTLKAGINAKGSGNICLGENEY